MIFRQASYYMKILVWKIPWYLEYYAFENIAFANTTKHLMA